MQDKSELNNPSRSINNLSGLAPVFKDNPSENLVELPLPSKNQHIGKQIVEKLLIEGENVVSKTQFNSRPNNGGDARIVTRDLNNLSDRSNSAGLQRVSTVVNYENRQTASAVGEFESKLLGSPNSGSIEQMTCAAMFGKQYLLLGNENGLSVIDFSVNSELIKPRLLIRGCSFKKIQVLDEYGIVIAIAGKKQMIRIYKLDSLLHLIKFMLQSKTEKPVDCSKTNTFLKKITDLSQRCDCCGNQLDENVNLEGSKTGKTMCRDCKDLRRRSSTSVLSVSSSASSESNSSLFPGKLHQRTLSNITSHLTDYIQQHLASSLDNVDISADERANVWQWSTDYVKLLESAKDCITFDVKETKSYLYLTVVTPNNMIHLFNCETCAKDTRDVKFELAQTYWAPGTPTFIGVSTDAFVINKMYIGINGKAAIIDSHSSVVTEINMPKVLVPRFAENPAWRSFTPIPLTCSLEFLVENPVEFDTQVSVIPLSTNIDVTRSPPTSPTSPVPSDQMKFSNSPLRRSTYRNRKSLSSSTDLSSGSSISKKPHRRSAIVTNKTLSSATSPLDSVIFLSYMSSKQQGDGEQPINDPSLSPVLPISPPISPTFTNISSYQQQQSMTAQFGYVPYPAPHESSLTPTNLPHSFNPESHTRIKPISSKSRQQIEAPLPSSLFLATICNVSHLVNDKGEPYKYNRPIRWSSPPDDISLLPNFNDIYVIGFQSSMIELASMKSGKIIRKITSGCPVKFLGESSRKEDSSSKDFRERDKKELENGLKRNIFWSCKLGEEYHFYRGRIID